jgi:HlyD family secretion protein
VTVVHPHDFGAPNQRAQAAFTEAKPLRDEIKKYLWIGSVTAVLLVGGIGGWTATTNLAGAVVAPGTLVNDSYNKKVQHPTGGVVGEIAVHDGDKVEPGAVVMRLDETIARASLGVITSQLDELAVRLARLKAERDEAETIALPASLASRADTPEVREMIAGERSLFESRRSGRAGQEAQMNERINQLMEEIRGLEAVSTAKSKEIELATSELTENTKLWDRNLIPLSRFTALHREQTRISGGAQLIATIAKIAKTRLAIIGLDRDHKTEVMKDLRETQAKVSELTERRAAAEDMLRRVEIRAPQSGIVHELGIHTAGGVVSPGEQIMLIVPEGENLVIEARIDPRDIDHVHVGQDAFIRFRAFNQRTTPEFRGTVIHLAADLTKEPQQAYFVARIGLSETELASHPQFRLPPGMSAEIYSRTTERTALSYLVKPLADQIMRAFRER